MREGLMDDTGYNFFEADDCTHYESCTQEAYERGQTDLLMPYDVESIEELIENVKRKAKKEVADSLETELLHWEDWILAESPTGYNDAIEYSADDMKAMICRTIREAKTAIVSILEQVGREQK